MNNEKLPKPTPADYVKREYYDKLKEDGISSDQSVDENDFLISIDWQSEIFRQGDKIGLKNALGELLLPAVFHDMKLMSYPEIKKGERIVARHNDKWGVVLADGIGTWLVKPEYDFIGYPGNLTHVSTNGKWGVLDISTGEYLIPPICEAVHDFDGFLFSNGIGFYTKDGKIGVLTYNAFTEPVFDDVDYHPEGWVKVKCNDVWGFINEDNQFTADEDEAYYSYSYGCD